MWDLPLILGTKPPRHSDIRRAITAAGVRINLLVGKQAIAPFDVTYCDFAELVCANARGKTQLIPIVDHASKLVLRWGPPVNVRSPGWRLPLWPGGGSPWQRTECNWRG